jgi:hypothetical protein
MHHPLFSLLLGYHQGRSYESHQWSNSQQLTCYKPAQYSSSSQERYCGLHHPILAHRPNSVGSQDIAKAMAPRLCPKMNDIISTCQSALIKSQSIHDNFMYVRNVARPLHRNHTLAMLIKLGIANAFDSVR